MNTNLKVGVSVIFFLAIHLKFDVSTAQPLPAACPDADARFLTGPEFLNNSSMSVQQIRNYLRHPSVNSWLAGDAQGRVLDTNGQMFDFAQALFDAADYPNRGDTPPISRKPINPQLLLMAIQKESRMLFLPTRPTIVNHPVLRLLTGCGNPSTMREQLQCAARTLRNHFDALAACRDTPQEPPWNLESLFVMTGDGIAVIPSNASTVAHYAYNPVAGIRWGGNTTKGGVALSCRLWHRDMKRLTGIDFARPPADMTLAATNPTLTCSDPLIPEKNIDRRNVTLSVSGGTPPYTCPPPNKRLNSACGTNQEDAVLKPPPNPGRKVLGTAYKQFVTWDLVTACPFICSSFTPAPLEGHYDRDCNDQRLPGSCFGGGCDRVSQGCTATPIGPICRADADAACNSPSHCDGDVRAFSSNTVASNNCSGVGGTICNKRTPEMIMQQCNPCGITMEGGATVTVTDSSQPPVTRSVTVTVR